MGAWRMDDPGLDPPGKDPPLRNPSAKSFDGGEGGSVYIVFSKRKCWDVEVLGFENVGDIIRMEREMGDRRVWGGC